MKFLIVGMLWLCCMGSALAECYLDGQAYDEGTVVSGYVCSGGEWNKL